MAKIFTAAIFVILGLVGTTFSMTRTLKKSPAIVLAAFGTTTKARVTYDFFEEQLRRQLSLDSENLKISWAFTSEIIRERSNKKFKQQGIDRQYLSLAQVLANLENEGYRKVVVQPLHIFPGQEFMEVRKVVRAFKILGLRIELGQALLDRWKSVFTTIDVLQADFENPQNGCNVIVAHGTPKTSPASNNTYLGLDLYLKQKFSHVFLGTVSGLPTREQALASAKNCAASRIRFIPLMFVAGDHIMRDIMGTKPNRRGQMSWSTEIKQAGFETDVINFNYKDISLLKGLGFYPAVNQIFIKGIEESLKRLEQQ